MEDLRLDDRINLGHYYRNCPRSRIQAQEKRIMEKELLNYLEPKDKEHQRKKILRTYFSYVYRNEIRNDKDGYIKKFWSCVRKLNPDNIYSDDRYKSMSYEYLDRLLDKPIFQVSIKNWLPSYEETLTQSEDDLKSVHFIKFINHTIEVKQKAAEKIKEFIKDNSIQLPNYPIQTQLTIVCKESTLNNGLYFEGKCSNEACEKRRVKLYFYIGINGRFDCKKCLEQCECEQCGGRVSLINVGVQKCKWSYCMDFDDQTIESPINYANYYTYFDDVHFYNYTKLEIILQELDDTEKRYLENLIFDLVEDTNIPKKKYRPRKKNQIDISPELEEFKCVENSNVQVQTELIENLNSNLQGMEYQNKIENLTEVIYLYLQELEKQDKKEQALRARITYIKKQSQNVENLLRH